MLGNQKRVLVGFLLMLAMGTSLLLGKVNPLPPVDRDALMKSFGAGNYRDAYNGLRQLALDPREDPLLVGKDLETAVQCLQNLGRLDEFDSLIEGVIAVHRNNWRLLETAARIYAEFPHYGGIVAGKFHRGNQGGGNRWVNIAARDHVRTLQLLQKSIEHSRAEPDKAAVAQLHVKFANHLLSNNPSGPGMLYSLTDLTRLPDYEDLQDNGNGARGASVDPEGNPIFISQPQSFEKATNDGERGRWLLTEAARLDSTLVSQVDLILADFFRNHFGVHTLASHGIAYGAGDKDSAKTSIFSLSTLGDDETTAYLATGPKRFKIPDDCNWIKIYRRIADRGKSNWGETALDSLAHVYENRLQFEKAAQVMKRALEEYGPGSNQSRQHALEQITGNWGSFEPGQMQPSGKKASIDFRFRNGSRVSFEAFPVKLTKLIDDIQTYLRSGPPRLQWERLDLNNIGYRLVERQEEQYLGEKVAAWDADLKPRSAHWDSRVTLTTPLEKPGAYLVNARMADGNLSRTIVWISDTILVKKHLDGKILYFVADAATGHPIPGVKLDFFGWQQQQIANQNQFKVDTTRFDQKTDENGQVLLAPPFVSHNYQWMVVASKEEKIGPGRFAYLGFNPLWFSRSNDPQYNPVKVFSITDRPVYRPEQTVHFKFWIAQGRYDTTDPSSFANQSFLVTINNPRGEKIFEKEFTSDAYGGLAGDFPLVKNAMLGTYFIMVTNHGGGSFRVEEYKKPEFEVTVEAPKEPVSLGDRITATIRAKYYFGAPVTHGRVKYKVARTSYSQHWFPHSEWDWLYGKGYGWLGLDYDWYPGWLEWGMRRPPIGWWGRHTQPPEIVLENDVPVGADGTVKITIDTRAAKELHGDQDHEYAITAEVVDESRRTMVGTGNVLVARKPFQVYTWLDRGYYRAGDPVTANFHAQTLDGNPVAGHGQVTLFQVRYNEKREPVETPAQVWNVDTDAQGKATHKIKPNRPGQYRLSYRLTGAHNHTEEGGYLFVVRGPETDGRDFRFNDLELLTEKREYAPGEKVRVLINSNQNNAVVLLFVRPMNGIYPAPRVLRLKGKSIEEEIDVVQKDMPNFFLEAVTVSDGAVHTETREVIVPPEKRVLKVEVQPSRVEYLPGQPATVKIRLTDLAGKPFVGSTAVTVYDKSVDYIAGASNVPNIKEFFWKWQRQHYPQTETSIRSGLGNLLRSGEIGMASLGTFGVEVIDLMEQRAGLGGRMPQSPRSMLREGGGNRPVEAKNGLDRLNKALDAAPADKTERKADRADEAGKNKEEAESQSSSAPPPIQPTIRKNFADTAFWASALETNAQGEAEISLTMPENLTAWKIKVWGLGQGTRVGQGEAEVVTRKNLLVRLQAPRFFVQKDEVVLSANVHNYLKTAKQVRVILELGGGTLTPMAGLQSEVRIPAGGEQRVNWCVRVTGEGEAIVRMKALSDEESDAMEMRFPCFIHGMLKTDSFAGVLRPDKDSASVTLSVPAERRVNDSRLEVRYSPTLAGAMVDALPYLSDYPYGCTEQTLNRFLPTIVTQHTLRRLQVDLKDLKKKHTNLNAQEIGEDRSQRWKRKDHNPVFDEDEVARMAQTGLQALVSMQISDGGWGWFSGYGEQSYPHTTAVVVQGLQLARDNDAAVPPGVIERGVEWLKRYQSQQIALIKNSATKTKPWKDFADDLDAFIAMVLVESDTAHQEILDFLYRDRTHLSVDGIAMLGLSLQRQKQDARLAMILKNLDQYLVQDDENQTAYLKLPGNNYWWAWYGNDVETNANYLRLLSRTSPKDERASRLVKYLLNNRKNGSYWNSTRDTATCVEAMADYLAATGEDRPEQTVEIWLDGKKHKEVKIDPGNLFTFDNRFILEGDAITSGKHTLEVRRKGNGPVYFNAYLTNFTLEDPITRTGLEVKVNRKYYKLTRVDKEVKVQGARGQVLDQKVEKYQRSELPDGSTLTSGDLVEIELEIDSKNDYEYLIFEDPKAAGMEPFQVQSGYNSDGLGSYTELRDDRVCSFVRYLPRGKHSLSYRMRAEIPGRFSALPTRAYAMYAPELRANSDELKVGIDD